MKIPVYLKTIILAVVVMTLMAACNKVSHNGAIDGNWQIMTIEDKATGETVPPDAQRYIAIQLHVMQLISSAATQSANMTYDKATATIVCDFPYVKENEVAAKLGPFGVRSNPITFEVVKADRSSLVLRTPETVITCRRY